MAQGAYAPQAGSRSASSAPHAPEYMTRVFSVQFVAGGITQPLSLVAASYGVGIAFLAAGAVFLLAIVIDFSSRELRRV